MNLYLKICFEAMFAFPEIRPHSGQPRRLPQELGEFRIELKTERSALSVKGASPDRKA